MATLAELQLLNAVIIQRVTGWSDLKISPLPSRAPVRFVEYDWVKSSLHVRFFLSARPMASFFCFPRALARVYSWYSHSFGPGEKKDRPVVRSYIHTCVEKSSHPILVSTFKCSHHIIVCYPHTLLVFQYFSGDLCVTFKISMHSFVSGR
jgi:hypothetical protein